MAHLRATPPVDPNQPELVIPRMPPTKSERKNGIPVTDSLVAEIREVCESCRVEVHIEVKKLEFSEHPQLKWLFDS